MISKNFTPKSVELRAAERTTPYCLVWSVWRKKRLNSIHTMPAFLSFCDYSSVLCPYYSIHIYIELYISISIFYRQRHGRARWTFDMHDSAHVPIIRSYVIRGYFRIYVAIRSRVFLGVRNIFLCCMYTYIYI